MVFYIVYSSSTNFRINRFNMDIEKQKWEQILMPYTKSPRPYKKEYKKQKERGEHSDRMERQRARRAYDKKGVSRKGKDVSHNKMLSRGGSNKDGTRLESASKNRSRNGKKPKK